MLAVILVSLKRAGSRGVFYLQFLKRILDAVLGYVIKRKRFATLAVAAVAFHLPQTNYAAEVPFGSQNVISTAVYGARSVFAADLDGDGDLDVLSASYYYYDARIAWYENTDGAGTFSAQKVIDTSSEGDSSVFSADIDGDGDFDVLWASSNYDKIAWNENLDGAGSFGAPKVISTATNAPKSVFAADLDGDGDLDVLSASDYDDKIAWYENTDGDGTFGAQEVISTLADGASSVFAADVDGDGDLDVLSASRADDKIAWYENTDGDGNFGAQNVISTLADGAYAVFAADVDGGRGSRCPFRLDCG